MLLAFRRFRRAASVTLAIGSTGCFVVLDLPEVEAGGSGGDGGTSGSGASAGASSGGNSGSSSSGGSSGSSGGTETGGSMAGGSGGTTGGGGSGGGSGSSTGGGSSSGGSAGAGGASTCVDACDCDGDTHDAPGCGGLDCDDDDPDVFEGQTQYFDVASKNGGFDYDCSGDENPEYSTAVACDTLLGFGCENQAAGFLYVLPTCGDTGQWGDCQLGGPLGTDCQEHVISSSRPMKCK